MSDIKLWTLIKKIEASTAAGKLEWQEVNEATYTAVIAGNSIKIRERYSIPEEADYIFEIYNEQGDRLLERTSDVDLHVLLKSKSMLSEGNTPYVVLKQLFQGARRKATGVDSVIDGMLRELGGAEGDVVF